MSKAIFELDLVVGDNTDNGLALELTSGQGPLQFTIKPNPNFRFTLGQVLSQLADLLNVQELNKIATLSTKAPWSNIFNDAIDWSFEPSLVVKVDKTASSIQLQIDLYADSTKYL